MQMVNSMIFIIFIPKITKNWR